MTRVGFWTWLKRAGVSLLLVLTLGFCFAAGTWLSLRFSVRRSPVVRVPDLIGQDSGAAEEALRTAGLAPEVAGRRYDPKQPEGKVLAQIPPAGSSTRPGRPVRLVVSLGTRRTGVPDVLGSSEVRAQVALRTAGLDEGTVLRAPDATVGAGRVLGQHPPPGTEGSPGERVDLLLSSGPLPRRFVMPDVVGRRAAVVTDFLARHGFRNVRVQSATPGTLPGAIIASQEPRAGFPVAPGDPVVLGVGPP